MFWIRFVPDPYTGTGSDCCEDFSFPVQGLGESIGGEGPINTYTTTIFDTNITVGIGRYEAHTGTGSATAGECSWKITAEGQVGGLNAGLSITKWWKVDMEGEVWTGTGTANVGESCLDVTGMEIGTVNGPDGCTGKLILLNHDVARLPYVRRTDAKGMTSTTGTGSSAIEFIDVDCGGFTYTGTGTGTGTMGQEGCSQVCRTLCVTGNRVQGGGVELVEFTWVDSFTGTGILGIKGKWEYWNPITRGLETIWLKENDAGQCYLDFNWTGAGASSIPNTVIDTSSSQGCSCGLKETVAIGSGVTYIGFTVRCGYCTCYQFYCGTCRCVPREICAIAFVGGVIVPKQILTWDDTLKAWRSDTVVATGTGSGGRQMEVYLEVEEVSRRCVMVPYFEGQRATDEDQLEYLDCGQEHRSDYLVAVGKAFDSANDLNVSGNYNGKIDDKHVWMAWGPSDGCRLGDCSATPCTWLCGSDPQSLTATIRAWNVAEECEEGAWDETIEIPLTYWHRWYIDPETGNLASACGYHGAIYHECAGLPNRWIIFDMDSEASNDFTMSYMVDGSETVEDCFADDFGTQECEPYYAEGISGDAGATLNACWVCGYGEPGICNISVIVTED
jgi:hypothetical protein